jgi:hypothetical protein
MKTRDILLAGSVIWIAYMLYSNANRDKKIKSLSAAVVQTNESLKNAILQLSHSFTVPPKYIGNGNDNVLFPAGIQQDYNSTKNATVAPAMVQVRQ